MPILGISPGNYIIKNHEEKTDLKPSIYSSLSFSSTGITCVNTDLIIWNFGLVKYEYALL